jgi:hypothetical protein
VKRIAALCCLCLLAVALAGCQHGAQASAATSAVPPAPATSTPLPTVKAIAMLPPGPPHTIAGTLMYPADSIPPLQVFAVDVSDAHHYLSVKTSAGQLDFAIAGVAPGTYHVLAYVQAGFMTGNAKVFAAAYTTYATCMQDPTCSANVKYPLLDHTLLSVTVTAAAGVAGVPLWDWYASPGIFPPPPGS